ncbi:hypothetical protein ACGFZQ_42285 [Streptomyces sp. NPDC048254]
MTTASVFTGLKVLDASSFIAGPAAATVLSDSWHLANHNKRGMVLDL